MIAKLIEWITGKDDLERVAYREDIDQLDAYLRTRRVWVPQRPKRFLDADRFTPEELMQQIRADVEELAGEAFEPWILEVDGKRRLPAFSNRKRMGAFSGKISQQLNKVFSLGCIEILLEDITKHVEVDYVDLNLFSRKSWEIGIGARRGGG